MILGYYDINDSGVLVQLPDQMAVISQALVAMEIDVGAVFSDESIAALATFRRDPAEWERIKLKLRKYKVITDVKKRVDVFLQRRNFNRKPYTSCTSNTTVASRGGEGTPKVHQTYTKKPIIKENSLIVFDEESGGASLMVESEAALTVREALDGYLCYRLQMRAWYFFNSLHWELLAQPEQSDQIIYSLLYPATGALGFRPCYANNIKTMIVGAGLLPYSEKQSGLIPFKNGLLDVATKELIPTTPRTALDWCLPYEYSPDAGCPHTTVWLKNAVDGDEDTFKFLIAWMAATLHGMPELQKFLHLKGSGGTGKGVFMRLLTALVGSLNVVETNIERLETNRFESAKLVGKRLCLITEAGRYGGSVDNFKALTGQDSIPLERKNEQQAGGFTFEGLVVMASNESLQTTDHTTGLERRRLTVIFNRVATDEEKNQWQSMGGEEAVLHSELAGLVNLLLTLSKDEIRAIIRNPPARIASANLDAMTASNPLVDWLLECCYPETEAWTQIGDKREIRNQGCETAFEGSDDKLYPNFLVFCQRNFKAPLSTRRFKELVIQAAKGLGVHVFPSRHSSGEGLNGIRIKKPWEKWPEKV